MCKQILKTKEMIIMVNIYLVNVYLTGAYLAGVYMIIHNRIV